MDEDLNLARGAELQSGLHDLGDLRDLAHVGLDHHRLGAVGLDLLGNLLRALPAAGSDISDNDVGATLAEENGDAGTDAAVIG